MDHRIWMWTLGDISFEIVGDMTDDPVVTLLVSSPAGQLPFMAEPVMEGRMMVARRVHVQDASPNAIGTGNLLAEVVSELTEAGIAACVVQPARMPDVRELRERLQLTRDQCAIRYGLYTETLRNREAGRRKPDLATCSYLRAVSNDPEHVERAYAPAPTL